MTINTNQHRPNSVILKGAAIASLIVALLYGGFFGSKIQSGIGIIWEIGLGVLITSLGIVLLGLFHALYIAIGRVLPRIFKGNFFNSLGTFYKSLPIPSTSVIWASAMFFLLFLTLISGFPFPFAFLFGPFIIIIEAILGGATAFIISGGFKNTGTIKKVLVILQVVLILAFNIFIIVWLSSPGNEQDLIKYETYLPSQLTKLNAPDPSLPGKYTVATLTYGSGTDVKRPEYGEKVEIKTNPVDASIILKGYKGFKAKVRTWYWGFDIKKFPLNGRVWYPEGTGPFPLVLIVHGNHNMSDYSDPGYAYLGELLASQGFITVSVDENFFNGGITGGIPSKKSENAARGWLLLKHLDIWKSFNENQNNTFYAKVDMENIALIGHSRGGEAVAHAAAQNKLSRFTDDGNLELGYGFNIKTIIAIAPVDGQYRPSQKPLPLKDVNYFSIQGSHDADMSSFHGNRQYQRVAFSDSNFHCKATLYIYRANHGQFNTVWGRTDFSAPLSWFLNLKPLLPTEDQLKISKLYLSAFLQATIQGKKEYLPMFRNHRTIIDLLPKTLYISRYEDSTFTKIADFEEDIDLLTGTATGTGMMGQNLAVWSEDCLKFRTGKTQENHVVRLGWKKENKEDEKAETTNIIESNAEGTIEPARYTVTLSDDFSSTQNLNEQSMLVFSITNTGDTPPEPEEDSENKTEKNNNKNQKEKNKNSKESTETDKKKDEEKDPLDLTLEVVDTAGNTARLPLTYYSNLHPPFKTIFTKWPLMESAMEQKSSEPVLETFEFPLGAFKAVNPEFEPGQLVKIVFIFDKNEEGMIYLDEIGFRSEI